MNWIPCPFCQQFPSRMDQCRPCETTGKVFSLRTILEAFGAADDTPQALRTYLGVCMRDAWLSRNRDRAEPYKPLRPRMDYQGTNHQAVYGPSWRDEFTEFASLHVRAMEDLGKNVQGRLFD